MKRAAQTAKWLGVALVVVLAAGVAAPYLRADHFGKSIRESLQRALGRPVEFGEVRFSLFKGPGFQIANVVIHAPPYSGA